MALHDDLSGALRLTLAHYGVAHQDAAAILGLSRTQFARRMQGTTVWTVRDLDRIVQRFGVPADLLFAGGLRWIEHLTTARAHPFDGRVQTAIL